MGTLIYILIGLAAILAIAVCGLFLILGWVLQSSFSSSDALWGWGLIGFGILYPAHPYLIYWLFGRGSLTAAIAVALFFIACSVGMLFVLPTAIGASARP